MSDYQTHVFTSTYTADVSGVCSALYELGGMTVIHDPSGCNSTYSTHDEPRWFDTDSLMFVSGLDEMTAVLGDDNVLIDDVTHAVRDLKPRFVTLCSGSIPHIIAFDCKGVVRIDYLVDQDTNDLYVNEINTIPGSLAFYLWEPCSASALGAARIAPQIL